MLDKPVAFGSSGGTTGGRGASSYKLPAPKSLIIIVGLVLTIVLTIEMFYVVDAIASRPPFSNNNADEEMGTAGGGGVQGPAPVPTIDSVMTGGDGDSPNSPLVEEDEGGFTDTTNTASTAADSEQQQQQRRGVGGRLRQLLDRLRHRSDNDDFAEEEASIKKRRSPKRFVQWETSEVEQKSVDTLLDSIEVSELDAIVLLSGGNKLPKWVRTRVEAGKMLQEGIVARLRRRLKEVEQLIALEKLPASAVEKKKRQARLAGEKGDCYRQQQLDIQERLAAGGPPIILSGGGTPHVAPTLRTDNGVARVLQEATEMGEYLRSIGYTGPTQKEIASYDTLGQAFYLRLLFAGVENWRRVLILTSTWHLERVQFMFDVVFGLPPSLSTELIFVGTTPGTDDPKAIQERLVHEKASLAATKKKFDPTARGNQHLTSFAKFHHWIFVNHSCYDEHGPRESAGKKNPATGNNGKNVMY